MQLPRPLRSLPVNNFSFFLFFIFCSVFFFWFCLPPFFLHVPSRLTALLLSILPPPLPFLPFFLSIPSPLPSCISLPVSLSSFAFKSSSFFCFPFHLYPFFVPFHFPLPFFFIFLLLFFLSSISLLRPLHFSLPILFFYTSSSALNPIVPSLISSLSFLSSNLFFISLLLFLPSSPRSPSPSPPHSFFPTHSLSVSSETGVSQRSLGGE